VIQSKQTHYNQQQQYRQLKLFKGEVKKGVFAKYLDRHVKAIKGAK